MGTKKDIAALSGISDESVENGTGKRWKEWMDLLDREGAANGSHKEIVAILSRYIDNGWRCQSVANAYEKFKGKRILGQTSDGRYQMGLSKTWDLPLEELWELIASEKGMEIWLGRLQNKEALQQTELPAAYRTEEGLSGRITVVKPNSHFRLSWQARDWDHSSVLQLRLVPKGEKTSMTIHHEGLASSAEREEMKARWAKVMEKLQALAKSR